MAGKVESFQKAMAQVVVVSSSKTETPSELERSRFVHSHISVTGVKQADNVLFSNNLNITKRLSCLEPERSIKDGKNFFKIPRCFWSGTGNGDRERMRKSVFAGCWLISLASGSSFISLALTHYWYLMYIAHFHMLVSGLCISLHLWVRRFPSHYYITIWMKK